MSLRGTPAQSPSNPPAFPGLLQALLGLGSQAPPKGPGSQFAGAGPIPGRGGQSGGFEVPDLGGLTDSPTSGLQRQGLGVGQFLRQPAPELRATDFLSEMLDGGGQMPRPIQPQPVVPAGFGGFGALSGPSPQPLDLETHRRRALLAQFLTQF